MLYFHVVRWHGRTGSFAETSARLSGEALAAELALLGLVSVHGLAGLRDVLADWAPRKVGTVRGGMLLVAVGAAALVVLARG